MERDYPSGEENYKKFIAAYNKNMKEYISQYWTLNDSVEYLSSKDIKKLVDGRNRKYSILTAVEEGGDQPFITRFKGTAVAVVLYRAENTVSSPDYKIFLPYALSRFDEVNTPADFKFVVQTMASNINYMTEKKRTSDFLDYMETMSIDNCKLLKDKTLLIDKNLADPKIDKKEIKERYEKTFKLVDSKDVAEAVAGDDESKCHIVLIPYTVYKSSMDYENGAQLICYKVIVNASDSKILNYMKGKPKAGSSASLIQEKDFKDLNSCEK